MARRKALPATARPGSEPRGEGGRRVATGRPGAEEDRAGDAAAALAERLAQGGAEAALALARALHPAELAAALAGLSSEERALLLGCLHPDELAPVVGYLEPRYRPAVCEGRSPAELTELAVALPDDLAADLVQSLPRDVAEAVVAGLSRRARGLLQALAAHPPHTAAGRMTGQVFTVSPGHTVAQTIQALRAQRPEVRRPFYAYVVDAEGRLVGSVGFAALLFAAPETRVGDLMAEALSVRADTDQEEAARLVKRRKLLALPVVDAEGHLLGALTVDDVLDVLEDEATEDILRLAGVRGEEALESVLDSVRFRLPWLAVNLAALMLAAWVISLFESTIARAAVIAVFLPVVLGQGGNGGLQTVTVVVRSLALGRIAPRHTLRVARSETVTALVTGGAVGVTVGLLAWGWQGNAWLGLVVGTALVWNQLVGAVAGVGFPMGLHWIRQDPAVSAPIWLTNATDVLGALGLLGIATLLVSRL
jgi:magnesium transporter